nr:zinc-binding dehydrogenase [Halorubrum tebenquichense]
MVGHASLRGSRGGDAVAEATGGVDHVVGVGGAGTLQQSLDAAAPGGHIHLIGVLAGGEGRVHPGPILGKGLTVEGVMGVGSQAMFGRMTDALAATGTTPVVDSSFGFDEVSEAYRYVERGDHQGKVVVSLD